MTARRKQEAVLRVLRGERLERVARENGVTVAGPSGWRDRFLDGGAASLKSRPRDDRDGRIAQLQAKLGGITMEFAHQEIGLGDRFQQERAAL